MSRVHHEVPFRRRLWNVRWGIGDCETALSSNAVAGLNGGRFATDEGGADGEGFTRQSDRTSQSTLDTRSGSSTVRFPNQISSVFLACGRGSSFYLVSRETPDTMARLPLSIQAIESSCCVTVPDNKKRKAYSIWMWVLTFFIYCSYHLSRKPISVVKNVLNQNCTDLTPPVPNPNNSHWCDWKPFGEFDAVF
ncbi:uncharacterized protein LOC119590426 [Penaeus monodon]|uniref:uncharacterized protein LOC119590426 n=1 Tax=Penaeus monodon TaxID=6687 RepID=UPI0018A7885A|nr:uncharacterized protein LOC119590426 [Penaeus monodon]